MKSIQFRVYGRPAPKGSSRAMNTKNGKAVNVPSGSQQNKEAQATWAAQVVAAARLAVKEFLGDDAPAIPFMGVALRMTAIWYMQRPAAHYHSAGSRKGQLKANAPKYKISSPDSSKLLRATEDSMNMLVFDDDARIAEHQMRKVYAPPGSEGAWIKLEEIVDAEA